MKTQQWLIPGSVALFVLMLTLNLYVFFTREWESSFTPSSYATLYYPLDVPTIREWKLRDRNRMQLVIACTKEISDWKVITDGRSEQAASGMMPSFRIDTTFSELHTYRLVPVNQGGVPPVELSIRFYGSEFYASLGMQHPDVYIVRANVPCGDFEQYPISDWVDTYAYVGEAALGEVDNILQKEVGIRKGETTFARMEKLFPYLRKKLKGSGGVPKDDERWMNPWLLYNELANGTGKGWCTQNAQTWVFWANRAGIPTRFVFGARTQDNTIVYTGHSWAESYISEQHRWAFVDLSQSVLYIIDKEGQVLNTADILHLNQHNAFDSSFARIYVDWGWEKHPGIAGSDSLETVPFALCNEFYRSEFTSHSILKYRRPPNVEDVREVYAGFFQDRTFLWGNLERYLFKPPLAYSFYPTEGARTYLIRRLLFFAFVTSFVVVLLAVVAPRAGMWKRLKTS